jgi:diguanylate cyclase (GGDEF)-like protein/PAS domain S-box-containing protein
MDQQKLLAAITDQIPGLVAAYNIVNGQYVYVNNSVKQILGYTPEDFLRGGITFATSIIHPDDLHIILQRNNEALITANASPNPTNGEPIVNFEYRMKHKDGSWRWLHTDGSILSRDAQGKAELVLNISIDISDRKASQQKMETTAKETLSELKNIKYALDQSSIVAITDKAGVIQYVNDKFVKISKYSQTELLGKTHQILNSHYHSKEFIKNLWGTITAGKVWHGELQHQTKDSSRYWVGTTVTPLLDENGQPKQFIAIKNDITHHKQTEEALEQSKAQLESIIQSIQDGITVFDMSGKMIMLNEAEARMVGYTNAEEMKQNLDYFSKHFKLYTPIDKKEVPLEQWPVSRALRGETFSQHELWARRVDIHREWFISFSGSPVFGADGKQSLAVVISRDITERQLAQEQLQKSEYQFRSLIVGIEDHAIFRLDKEGNITSWNEGIEHILGYREAEIVGKSIRIFFTERDQEQGVPQQLLEQAAAEGNSVHEGIRVRKDGTSFYAVVTTTAIFGTDGTIEGFSTVMRDITDLKEAEETIRFQALHDALTGLSNRKALDEHYALAYASAMRNKHKLAVLFLDLDRFKTINDTLGHGIGDMILKEVAHRLQASVRKVDTVARLGGDEFIILLTELHSVQDVTRVAEKILEAFTPVIRVQDQSLHISTSIGIALFPADGQDIYTLLKNADTALYRAKDAGRNRFQYYNYSMNLQSVAKLSLEQDLRNATARGELVMLYQPFVSMKNGTVLGIEALIRWNHPKLGLLLPYDFIPLAEETGMIVPIGKWILHTVCEQGKQLRAHHPNLQMTVNLSARQFAEAELVESISDVVHQTQLEPSALELEITESVAMENISRTSSKLNDLKRMGVSIAIDDFGTGYSSLSYLKRFPVHKLKIDKSFIKHAITDSQDSTIIRAIISMGHSLGLKVCAEGVEDEQQHALLKSMGCDMVQGYLISTPLPFDDLQAWLLSK